MDNGAAGVMVLGGVGRWAMVASVWVWLSDWQQCTAPHGPPAVARIDTPASPPPHLPSPRALSAMHPFRPCDHNAQPKTAMRWQVKSYLAGNPPIRIKLNDDLLIARRDSAYGAALGAASGFNAGDYAADGSLVILDDCCFHEVGGLGCVWKGRAGAVTWDVRV